MVWLVQELVRFEFQTFPQQDYAEEIHLLDALQWVLMHFLGRINRT